MSGYAVQSRTVYRRGPYIKQFSTEEFQNGTTDSELAASAVRGTWTGALKRHGRLETRISSARGNGGPLATLYVWLRSLRNAGAPKALPLRLVVALQTYVEYLWADPDCTEAALLACSLAETESGHPVNRLQIVLAGGYCPVSAAELIERARIQAAALLALATAYEARLLKESA